MENENVLELIDGFLDGTLPETRLREVEQRLSQDAAFRQQVQLQRELREAYSNPGRWRLRSVMADIMEEEPQPPEQPPAIKNGHWWKWIALLVIIVAAGFGIWQWRQPDTTATPPVQEEQKAAEQPAPPIAQEEPEEPKLPAEEPKQPAADQPAAPPRDNAPIAVIDPAVFDINGTRETKLQGMRAVQGMELTLSAPAENANFISGPDKQVTLPFKGTLSDTDNAETVSVLLLLYDNKNRRPVKEIPIVLQQEKENKFLLDTNNKMALKPGLYYFMVETEDGDPLAGGKFTVDKK